MAREEWGSEVYWLLPEYSSATKEVKSEATGCQQTDLYTLRDNRVTVLQTLLVHVDVTETIERSVMHDSFLVMQNYK